MRVKNNEYNRGLIYILAVYFIWGFLPAYWKLLRSIDPVLILSHRVLWSFILLVILMRVFGRQDNLLETVKDKKNIILFILAGTTLLSQWIFYLLTIITGHIIELSLGYYIYPIIAVVFSRLFFREKLNVYSMTAFIFALAGVLILIIGYNRVPFLGLGVALSFALYSTVKKKLRVVSVISTFYEMLFLLPFALGYILYTEVAGKGYFIKMAAGLNIPLLLIGGGVLTCITLLLFASGARRISFSAVGFLQYISPTIVLILAVAVYKEVFSLGDWISFGFIWAAVIVYSLPVIRDSVRKKCTEK